jgi:hypothetical protein
VLFGGIDVGSALFTGPSLVAARVFGFMKRVFAKPLTALAAL